MKKLSILTLIIFSISCNSQDINKKFYNKIKSVVEVDNFPIIDKKYPPGFSSLILKEDWYINYLDIEKKSLYYIEEDYNHDEDIRIYGEKKPCYPVIRFKILTKKIISLIIDEYNGYNDGDVETTYLYTFTNEGKKISKVFLKDEMITYDGIPYTAFTFINRNRFNTYKYNYKEILINEKKEEKAFVEYKEYEIKDNGEIVLLKEGEQEEYLLEGDYRSPNSEKWPSNDPMKLLLNK